MLGRLLVRYLRTYGWLLVGVLVFREALGRLATFGVLLALAAIGLLTLA